MAHDYDISGTMLGTGVTPMKQLCILSSLSLRSGEDTREASESRSAVSNSLQPHRLYSPWNSPGQNTGVGRSSLSRAFSQPRDQTQVSCIAGGVFTSWATREAQISFWSLLNLQTCQHCLHAHFSLLKMYLDMLSTSLQRGLLQCFHPCFIPWYVVEAL